MISLEIPYNSPRHNRIRDALRERIRLSERHMSERYSNWNKMEELFQAYIPETEANQLRREKREMGIPQYTTVVIPYSYAMLLTAHTYWASVFLSRSPVFQYQGRHGEGRDAEMSVEALIDYQVNVGKMLVPLYAWLMDAPKYGLGVVGIYWDRELITCSSLEEEEMTILGVPIPGTSRRVRKTKTIEGYQGNRLFNVRPHHWLPDPRVPISQFQSGEFCGRTAFVGWNEIVRRADQGQYIRQNVDRLRNMKLRGANDSRMEEAGGQRLPDAGDTAGYIPINDVGFLKLQEIVVDLEPRAWEVGGSSAPEKWLFTLAEDEIILEARPFGAYHNQYPFCINEYEIDAYQLHKRGMLDVLEPLNNILTWLFDTHLQSVRKVINDQLIIDPSKLTMKDVLDPRPGRLWRLRPEAYGTDPRLAAHQLQVVDVTQNHMKDASAIVDIMHRVVGVNDNLMGMVTPGGRKTATEIRSSSTLGINRLKVGAEYNSALGWAPLAQMLLQNSQQYYSGEKKLRVAGGGTALDGLMGEQTWLTITPDSIAGLYDFVPVDGTMPIDRFAMSNLLRELAVDAIKMPGAAQQLDFFKLIQEIAGLNGVRNFNKFRIMVQPNAQVMGNVAKGNVVPLNLAGSGGGAEGLGGVPGPSQIPGLGPVA